MCVFVLICSSIILNLNISQIQILSRVRIELNEARMCYLKNVFRFLITTYLIYTEGCFNTAESRRVHFKWHILAKTHRYSSPTLRTG